jgi:DNA-binding CsgD family transcriptional regulator/tetratricopeptide (TPR) repeat protein
MACSSHPSKAILVPMTGRPTSTSFVGREEELGRLQRGLQSAAAGEPGTFLIAGEAGIGKTRLVREFADRVGAEAQVLLGSCIPLSGGGLPYGPIVDALRELTRGLDPTEVDEPFGPAPTDLPRLLPAAAPARSTEPAGAFAQSRLFESILRFLDRLAQEQPVVLILEDAHWADRSTLDVLVFLVRMVRDERLLVVATYRSDELHPQHPLQPALAELNRSRHVESIELAPFDREDLSRLLGGILDRPPSPTTVQRIFARSGGNAFLAEELLATEGKQTAEELPRQLQGILLARVAALAEDTKEVLRLTATVGRPVEHHLLSASSQLPEERLLIATREAVDRQVLRTEQDTYRFRHVLLQQAVYAELLPGERLRLHTAVANALTEDPDASALRRTSAELAHHWSVVGDHTRALGASIAAARAAAEVYGFAEAHHHYEGALSLWPRTANAHIQTGLTLPHLLLESAEAARWTGQADRAAALLQESLTDMGPHLEPARGGFLRARLAEYQSEAGDSKAALASYEEAARLVADEPASAEKARVLAGHGTELMRQAQYSASRALCEQAIAVARAIGAQAEEGRALNTLGCDLSALGNPEAGIAALRQALTLSEAAGGFDDIFRAYLNLSAVLDLDAGRPQDALEVTRQGLARMRQLGLELAPPSTTLRTSLAWGLWDLGHWQEAEQLVSEALTQALPATWELELQLLAGRLHIARGRFHQSHEQGQSAARLVEQLNDARSDIFLQRYLADLAIWQGDYDLARSLVARALEQLGGTEDHMVEVRLCWTGLRGTADAAEQIRDRRGRPSELRDLHATGKQLLAHARRSLGLLGGNLSELRANAAACEAEFTRVQLRSDSQQWEATVASWDALSRPYEAAYARWRQAEALFASKAPRAAASLLRQAHHAMVQLGERPLRHEIERLAQRTRIDLQPPSTGVKPASTSHVADHGLTPREEQVLRHLMEGRTNRQIARALFITEKTASVHVSNIMSKLGAANRSEAAAIAHRLRLLEPNA